MPNYRRLYIPGGTYAFTLALADRSSDLLVRHIQNLREGWRSVAQDWPFDTVAVCVLPDHLHMLITLPEGDHRFSERISRLKAKFTASLPESLKVQGRRGERGIWQSRFWEHAIRDERDLEAHVAYIHNNPVKHGLVAHPDDWPFSSWHRFRRDLGVVWTPSDTEIAVGEPER